MRDFYDIHILYQLYGASLSMSILHDAFMAIADKRGTLVQMENAGAVFDEIEQSPVMERLWGFYQKKHPYTDGLFWYMVMDSARALYLGIQNV